jgi:hypothetical protein
VLVFVSILLGGCAAAPEPRPVPDWVLDGPESSEDYVFFVGSGTSEGAGAAEAEDRATLTVVDEIVRYLGARIEVETTAQVQAGLDFFEEQIQQELRQESRARVEGLRIVDRFVQESNERTTVYILARYERSALEEERERLNALRRERVASVEVAEEQAREAMEAGNLYASIGLFVEAAVAASDERIDNADVKMQRNLADALQIARRISLNPVHREVEAFVGHGSSPEFALTVSAQPEGAPIPDARVVFSFPERTAGGRTVLRSRTVATDSEGRALFTPPPPASIGSRTVTARLAVREILDPVDAIEQDAEEAVSALRAALRQPRADFEYRVLSRAREVPTGVLILDADIAGNPVGTDDTTRGLVRRLSAEGFSVRRLSVGAEVLLEERAREVLETLREQAPEDLERVILGRARIEEFQEEDGYLVAVSGSVEVFDLESGRLLHAEEGFRRSRAGSSSGALSAAFSALGADLAEGLAVNLP